MTFLGALLGWASIPYLVTQGVALGFAALQASGLMGLLGGGGHDGEHDVDTDMESDSDTEADTDTEAEGDHEGDSDHAQGGSLHSPSFNPWMDLGVGRVPLSILWQTYAFSFGATGLVAHALYLSRTGQLPLWALAWSLPLSLVVGYLVTRQVSRWVSRVIAHPDQKATSRAALVGATGVVISSRVDGSFGEVKILDRSGHMVRVMCTVAEGEDSVVENHEVVVVEYDKARDRLLVAALDPDRKNTDSKA